MSVLHEEYWLWLANALGYGAANASEVLQMFEGNILQLYNQHENKELQNILTPAQRKRLTNKIPEDFLEEVEKNKARGVEILCYDSSDFPVLLKQISACPPVLYIKGDSNLLNGHLMVSMVGARRPSIYGVESTKYLGNQLAQAGMVIVSGLAAGLDAQAHKAAIAVEGATVACVAFGHGACYPANNRNLLEVIEKTGAVVSEYPLDTQAEKAFFLQRNRIIAALSQALVVVEARKRSGTMSTVNFAAEYGRDIFAVPGSIFSALSEGTNALLKEGASMVTSAEDILVQYDAYLTMGKPPKAGAVPLLEFDLQKINFLGVAKTFFNEDKAEKKKKEHARIQEELLLQERELEEDLPLQIIDSVSGDAQTVYEYITILPQSLDEICEKTNLGVAVVLSALTELELAGLVQQLAGRKFSAVQ